MDLKQLGKRIQEIDPGFDVAVGSGGEEEEISYSAILNGILTRRYETIKRSSGGRNQSKER
jgi:hypothetical protein